MKTKNKNIVIGLLAIRADFHNETFGKSVSWKSVNLGTKEGPNWVINIYEAQFHRAVSHNYEVIGDIARIAMVSHYLIAEDGQIKFHLY